MESAYLRAFLRRGTYSLSSLEESFAAQSIRDVDCALEICQAEMDQLMEKFWVFAAEETRLVQTKEMYQSLLSPIHRLPPEILARIFMFECGKFVLKPYSLPPPVCLSMVCGRWRDIALGTPALWSYIHFSFWGDDMELLPQHAGNRLVRKVQLLLNHSGNCPLDLTLDLFATDDWGTPAIPVYTEPIIDALVRHSHRWATLDLTAGQKVLSSASWLPISERLPLLRNLRFCPVRLNEDQQDLIVDFFGVCPVLNTCTSICGGRTALPWAQITAVELLEWKLDPIFQLLTPANAGTWKRLTLMLDVEVHQTVATGSIGSACLNMLNALTVEACLHTQIACGFDILTTPQLSSLEIRGCVSREFKDKFSSESWDGKPIAAFLKRSSCIITHLHLKWLPMTDKHAIFLLQQMPHIESLIIEECSRQVDDRRMNKIVVPSLLQKLLLDGSSPTERILPQLSSLELVVHVDVPIKLLAEVLKSRQHCLKLVDIKIIGKKGKRPPADFGNFADFRSPKQSGMRLSIGHYHHREGWMD